MTNLQNRFAVAVAAATVLATIVTVGVATPLRAETPADMVTTRVVVAYDDLDLATASGRSTMDHRIHRAAVRACGPLDLATRDAVLACRDRAITDAGVHMAALAGGNGAVQLAAAR